MRSGRPKAERSAKTNENRWLFAELTQEQIRRGVHRSTRELETAIRDYLRVYKLNPKPLVWTKTADEILASVARFCQRISNSGH
jgi:hypothetical protein